MCAILEGGNRSHGSHVEARPIVRDGQRVIRESPPAKCVPCTNILPGGLNVPTPGPFRWVYFRVMSERPAGFPATDGEESIDSFSSSNCKLLVKYQYL